MRNKIREKNMSKLEYLACDLIDEEKNDDEYNDNDGDGDDDDESFWPQS